MALECELLIELEPAVGFTCADGTGIEKGAVLEISDPMTVATGTGDDAKIIGIAAEEKIASDGKTEIAVYLRGIFKGFAGAAGVTVGRAIILDEGTGAANELVVGDANSEGIIGTALETATDTQSFKFLLNPINPVLA
jgi:hypothetical protein|tara:strand:- start:158 stop:571 length:414 start_codon:yes stop_codon:yes gene_type:complete